MIKSEIEQLKRGDIPYVYTYADSKSLFSDGREMVLDCAEKSAIEHALDNLNLLGEKDEKFDLALLERAIKQYPRELKEYEREKPVRPEKDEKTLPFCEHSVKLFSC